MPKTEIIVGMDTNSYGFHTYATEPIIGPGHEWSEMDVPKMREGWAQSSAKDVQDRRKLTFVTALEWFKVLPSGTWVFIEEPLVLRTNPATTIKLCMQAGVIEAAALASKADIYITFVNLTTWRKAVLGVGSGPAAKMKELAKRHVESGWPTSEIATLSALYEDQPDLYEAACICHYGVMQRAMAGPSMKRIVTG
jgi:hypothetical protein